MAYDDARRFRSYTPLELERIMSEGGEHGVLAGEELDRRVEALRSPDHVTEPPAVR